MIQRCDNPDSGSYEDYGARGIKVEDPRWYDFESFLADMGVRPEGKTLDRIDYERGYCKQNCRWATNIEQATNKRGVKLKPLKVAEIKRLLTTHMKQSRIAKKFGVAQSAISNIKRGVSWKEV
jgi:hypothetical protein